MSNKRFLITIGVIGLVMFIQDWIRSSQMYQTHVPWWTITPTAIAYTLVCTWLHLWVIRPQTKKMEIVSLTILFIIIPSVFMFWFFPNASNVFHPTTQSLTWLGQSVTVGVVSWGMAWLLDKITSQLVWKIVKILWAVTLVASLVLLLLIIAVEGIGVLLTFIYPSMIAASLMATLTLALTSQVTHSKLAQILVYMGVYMSISSLLNSPLHWGSLLFVALHSAISTYVMRQRQLPTNSEE